MFGKNVSNRIYINLLQFGNNGDEYREVITYILWWDTLGH